MKLVLGAEDNSGTIFWRITRQDLKRNHYYGNMWFEYMIDNYPLDEVLDDNYLFGSKITGDEIYLCETDGEPIMVGSNEEDPEEVLDIYPIKSLSEFIKDNPPDNVINKITDSELYFGEHSIDEIASQLTSINNFVDVCTSAIDLGILDL